MLNPKDHPKNIVTVSGTGNADYFTIQDAIDSVKDATAEKHYAVLVYPGEYTENIVGKNYVSITGVGDIEDIKIKATSGILYTYPSIKSVVQNVWFELSPTAPGAVVFDMSAGSGANRHVIDLVRVDIVSSTNGVSAKIIDGTDASAIFLRSDISYTMLGDSAGTVTHELIDLDGTSGLIMDTQTITITVTDRDDDYVLVKDAGTGVSIINDVFITFIELNAAWTGTAKCMSHQAAGLVKQTKDCVFSAFGSGAGTMIGLEVDSGGAAITVDSTGNSFPMAGFGTTAQFRADTGDTINSSNDFQNGAGRAIGAGTVNFVNTQTYGSLNITGGGAFPIDTANAWHGFSTLAVGEADVNMEVTQGSSAAITAFADATGGQVTVTSAGHGLPENDDITITGTTNYNGVFKITNVTTDTFEITDTWVANDATGTWNHGSHMLPFQKGAYKISWAFSVSAAGANKTFDFAAFKNVSEIAGTKITRQFQTAASIGSVSGEAIINLLPDDHLWFAFRNTGDATNITISEGSLTVNKVS